MTNQCINLPDKKHYRLEEIAKAIVGFSREMGDEKGIDCIKRKLTIPKLSIDPSPQYLFRLKGLSGSLRLNDRDRKALASILPELPEISHHMESKDIEKFFEEYYKIPSRPCWEPDITSPNDRIQRRHDFDERVKAHCNNFLSRAQAGYYHLFDSDLTVLTGSKQFLAHSQQALVTQQDAIKFLKHLELEFTIGSKIEEASVPSPQASAEQDAINPLGPQKPESTIDSKEEEASVASPGICQ